MNTAVSIFRDFILFFNPKTRSGQIYLTILVATIVAGGIFISSGSSDEPVAAAQVRAVAVAPVASFANTSLVRLIGTVSSVDQAVIQTEAAGRVTAVPVALGQSVSRGQVIARLENASEYASLLQAEGSYDAAVAAAQSSDISVTQAMNTQMNTKNDVVNIYRGAYSTVSNIVYNTLDNFYGNPNFSTPGVRVNTGGSTAFLNTERVAFQTVLPIWREKTNQLTTSGDLYAALAEARTYTTRTLTLVDTFIRAIQQGDETEMLDGVSLATYATTLTTARVSLNATLASLESAETDLRNAEETVARAQLGGTSGDVSSANAQIKQALGGLKAAQAQYEKTILRSPISGVVNVLDVKTGDFVSSFQKIAEVANNDALEVTTYIGEADRNLLTTNQEVRLGDTDTGVVTTIAPVVNAATGKIEVKIQSTSNTLINGDTVVVTLLNQTTEDTKVLIQNISVPLTAVKFSADAGLVFTVADGVLVSHDVQLGKVLDATIEITAGITPDMVIVVDARGLSAGEAVTVLSN